MNRIACLYFFVSQKKADSDWALTQYFKVFFLVMVKYVLLVKKGKLLCFLVPVPQNRVKWNNFG